jgi:type VI secretion system protein ImpJ
MRNLRRVVWSKGMFLTPQHFQSQDNYFEDTLQFRFTASQYANWGITDVAIDEEALGNGQLTILRCRGLMPDGAAFHCPVTDDLPASRPVAPYFSATQDILDAFLALPERRPQGRNVAGIGDGDGAGGGDRCRFTARLENVRDEVVPDDEKPVHFAGKNLQILFGGQNLDGFVRLRIAQIVKNQRGLYALRPDFVAPCLDIASSVYLMGLLKRQIEVLGTKSNSLSSARRQKGRSLADFNTSESASFWLLHTVNTHLPELRHFWGVRHGHPEPVFTALLRLAGALSTFSMEGDARALPDYDHDNLGPCFTALDEHVRTLLETVLPSKCITIPLKQTADANIWTGVFTNDQWLQNSQLLLAIGSQLGVDDLIRKVPQLVKISSPDDIVNIVRLALPGVTLRHNPAPPPAIPYRLENQYFNLNQSGRWWEGIVRSRNISLFMPPDLTGARPELFVVLP